MHILIIIIFLNYFMCVILHIDILIIDLFISLFHVFASTLPFFQKIKFTNLERNEKKKSKIDIIDIKCTTIF